jgi:hypothetical protein
MALLADLRRNGLLLPNSFNAALLDCLTYLEDGVDAVPSVLFPGTDVLNVTGFLAKFNALTGNAFPHDVHADVVDCITTLLDRSEKNMDAPHARLLTEMVTTHFSIRVTCARCPAYAETRASSPTFQVERAFNVVPPTQGGVLDLEQLMSVRFFECRRKRDRRTSQLLRRYVCTWCAPADPMPLRLHAVRGAPVRMPTCSRPQRNMGAQYSPLS